MNERIGGLRREPVFKHSSDQGSKTTGGFGFGGPDTTKGETKGPAASGFDILDAIANWLTQKDAVKDAPKTPLRK